MTEASLAAFASLSCFRIRDALASFSASEVWPITGSFFEIGCDVRARVLLLPTTVMVASMVTASGLGSSV